MNYIYSISIVILQADLACSLKVISPFFPVSISFTYFNNFNKKGKLLDKKYLDLVNIRFHSINNFFDEMFNEIKGVSYARSLTSEFISLEFYCDAPIFLGDGLAA